MAFNIPTAFVDQFSANVLHLSSQRMTRLRSTVDVESVTGDAAAFDILGTGQDTPNVVTVRHGDTPIGDQDHTRRWLYPVTYEVPADFIDRPDRVNMLLDPSSIYTRNHAATMGRGMDDNIIAALGAAAVTGHTGTGSSAFPAAQQIAAGATGLTLAKLLAAKEMLDASEVDPDATRWMIHSAKQMTDLLNDDKVTSADYNTVRALVNGTVDTFLGFRFKRTERLTKVSTTRTCWAYIQGAVKMGMQIEPNSRASERPDKRYAWQLYTMGRWGCVRLEDARVVQIDVTEA